MSSWDVKFRLRFLLQNRKHWKNLPWNIFSLKGLVWLHVNPLKKFFLRWIYPITPLLKQKPNLTFYILATQRVKVFDMQFRFWCYCVNYFLLASHNQSIICVKSYFVSIKVQLLSYELVLLVKFFECFFLCFYKIHW